MSKLTYDELVARNDRLARKIISMGDQFQEILRDEVKTAKAKAWDECDDAWEFAHRMSNLEPWEHLKDNPYKEQP